MKRIALISLFMALTLNAFSQEINNDTIIVKGDNIDVLINNNKIKIVDSQNGLKINVFSITEDGEVEKNPYYESRYENNSSDKTERKNITINFPISPTFIKDDKYTSNDEKQKLKFRRFQPVYPTIYYSYSALANNESLALQPQRSNSFEWGSYFLQLELCNNKKKTFGLTTAIGVSNTYNFFNYILGTYHDTNTNSDNYTYFYYGDEEQNIPDGLEDISTDEIKRSHLRYWSLRIPVSAQLQWKMGHKKMAFSFGPELEWRFAVRSKIKFEDGGKRTVSDNLAYNPFGINALAVLSFDDFVIFGRAGLTQLFNQSNSDINVVPVNLGIGLSF